MNDKWHNIIRFLMSPFCWKKSDWIEVKPIFRFNVDAQSLAWWQTGVSPWFTFWQSVGFHLLAHWMGRYSVWQNRLWSFKSRDTKLNQLLTKIEVFQRILWYLLKCRDLEPIKLGSIFTKKYFSNLNYMKSTNNNNCTFSEKLYSWFLVRAHLTSM